MSTADIIILVILGFGVVKGYLNGFIVEVVSFLGFFVGLILALQLTIPVTTWFFSGSNYYDLIAIVVFVALFFLLSISLKMGAKILKRAIDVTIFGTVDNVIGALTGAIKWGVLISMIAWIFDSVGFDLNEKFMDDSLIFPYIVKIGPAIFSWLGGIIPFIQDLIDSLKSIPSSKGDYMTFVY